MCNTRRRTSEYSEAFKNNEYIAFTLKPEKERSVPFLDTKLIRTNENKIILNWYVKPTSSGRYLKYHLYHAEKMKINVVLGLKNRIEKISYESLRQKKTDQATEYFDEQCIPQKITFETTVQYTI